MASLGSRRNFTYTDDEGTEWVCQLDEGTGEAGGLGFGQQPTAAALTDKRFLKMTGTFPLKPRYINTVQQGGATPGRRQKFFVGSNTAGVWGGATIVVVEGVTYQITSKVGEVRFLLSGIDTGLDDGDDDVPE